MKRIFFCCLALLGGALFPAAHAAVSHDPALQWYTLYTKHFEIHYHSGIEAVAQRVAGISERAHEKLARHLNWEPDSRTQMVLTDRFDTANGYATVFPHKEMVINVASPDSTSVLGDYDDWLDLLITHEYSHILHFDKAKGVPAQLRDYIGRPIFLYPNLLQPPWMIEGLATYEETDVMRGIGRGQNSVFRMLMRLEALNGIKPLYQVNQPLVTWPMNTTRYLYGVYFYQFLAERYGGQKVEELVDKYSDNLVPFHINSNTREVLGKEMLPLWDEFTLYLNEEFLRDIERIHATGELDGERLTRHGYYTAMPQLAADGTLYYLRRDMLHSPMLMKLAPGATSASEITRTAASQLDIHPDAGVVVAEIDWVNSTNWFSDLHHIDPRSGLKTRLTSGGRYLYATWSPDGKHLIAVHNSNGRHALHLLNAAGIHIDTLWSGSDETVIGPPDWSPDGRQLAASLWRPGSFWNLELFDITAKQWSPLTKGPTIEANPMFTEQGRALLFSADYTGVFNIYRLDLDTRHLTQLTQVIGGAFAPIHDGAQGIYYQGASADGFDIYHLAATQPREVNAELYLLQPPLTPQAGEDAVEDVEDVDAVDAVEDVDVVDELAVADEMAAQSDHDAAARDTGPAETSVTGLAMAETPAMEPAVSEPDSPEQVPSAQDQPAATTAPATTAVAGSEAAVAAIPGGLAYPDIEEYTPADRIASNYWLPYWQLDDLHNELGITIWGRDPLSRHNFNLTLAYDIEHDFGLGFANYVYDRWNPTVKFSLGREPVYYLGNNGSLERIRDSKFFAFEATWPYLETRNRLLVRTGVEINLESDKMIFSDFGSWDEITDAIIGVGVNYSTAQRHPRAISLNDGRNIRLTLENSDVFDSDFNGNIYTLDWREYIALPREQIFAIRGVIGHATGFARPFRLGGYFEYQGLAVEDEITVTSLVSTRSIFGKREFQLRGYPEGLPGLSGRRMRLLETEWRFPLTLVERGLMRPPIGIHQLHGKLFANWGEAWEEHESAPALRRGYGAELITEFILGYWLKLDVRLGYARGLDEGGEQNTYLELGTAF